MVVLALAAVLLARPVALIRGGTVIKGGTVLDGSGGFGVVEDVRIVGERVSAVGQNLARHGDRVIDATGLDVAPGFIDAHSHADGGIFQDPDAETQIRQGITTSVVGEDGDSTFPVSSFFKHLKTSPASLNFASFAGQGTIRHEVMGDAQRPATPAELKRMKELVAQEMRSGALGLSTGLEYVPGRYAKTEEIIELAKVAARHGGIYISHVRNEDNDAIDAFKELIRIAKEAHMPGEINHIKLCSSRVWGRAREVVQMMKDASKDGVDITADVYPYTYWQSTIRVIIPTEQFDDRAQWKQGLADVGGPEHVLLTSFTPDPSWAGKTIAEIATQTGKDPISVIQDIIRRCYAPACLGGGTGKGSESVVVTAMSEDDVTWFVASSDVMFCSDGGLHGSHPRGAGSFPRILGLYVRQRGIIPLPEAIRKMTQFPAKKFGFKDRGMIAPGKKADIVIFNPKTVIDTATTHDPQSPPVGISTVFVNGVAVLENGQPTHAHPGQVLTH